MADAAKGQRRQQQRQSHRHKKLLQTCVLQRSAIDNLHRALRLAAYQDYAEALVAFTAANTASSSAFDNQIEGLQELQGACTCAAVVLCAINLFDFAAVFEDSVQPAAEGVQSQPSLVQVHHECEKLKNRLGM